MDSQDFIHLKKGISRLILDSVWLRQAAHHIFHSLKDRGLLLPEEIKVYEAAQGVEPLRRDRRADSCRTDCWLQLKTYISSLPCDNITKLQARG